MRIYICNETKRCFIVSPKCGNTTIARYLQVPLHTTYSLDVIQSVLQSPDYKKIIIIRANIVDRFLSAWYEEVFANSEYDEMQLTFATFFDTFYDLISAHTPSVSTIATYPILSYQHPITTEQGTLMTHMGTQLWWIGDFLRHIPTTSTIEIVDTNDLSTYLGIDYAENRKSKPQVPILQQIFQQTTIADIKRNQIITTHPSLTTKQLDQLQHLYQEDVELMANLRKPEPQLPTHTFPCLPMGQPC